MGPRSRPPACGRTPSNGVARQSVASLQPWLLVWRRASAWRTNELPEKRRASSLTSHDNQGACAFKHGRAQDALDRRSRRRPRGSPTRSRRSRRAVRPVGGSPGPEPRPRRSARTPSRGRRPPSPATSSTRPGDHGGVRQTQLLDRELEERRPLGAALDQQHPDPGERDGDDHARQPGPRTQVGGLVDALDDRDRPEAVQGVAFPYPGRVRSGDRSERHRPVGEELLEPAESGDLRRVQEHPEVARLCSEGVVVAHRCFT